jgi:hypothetical protein
MQGTRPSLRDYSIEQHERYDMTEGSVYDPHTRPCGMSFSSDFPPANMRSPPHAALLRYLSRPRLPLPLAHRLQDIESFEVGIRLLPSHMCEKRILVREVRCPFRSESFSPIAFPLPDLAGPCVRKRGSRALRHRPRLAARGSAARLQRPGL